MMTLQLKGLMFAGLTACDALPQHKLTCRRKVTPDAESPLDRPLTNRRLLRVLVVDDGQFSGERLARQVHRWGHASRTADDGLAALRVAAAQHPDVVLILKLEMPVLDGCRLARQLRCDFPRKECLIIAVTDRADDPRRQQCIEAGINLVFARPVDPENLETLLILEFVHVNRPEVSKSASQARRDHRQYPCKKQSRHEWNSATKSLRPHFAVAMGDVPQA